MPVRFSAIPGCSTGPAPLFSTLIETPACSSTSSARTGSNSTAVSTAFSKFDVSISTSVFQGDFVSFDAEKLGGLAGCRGQVKD